MTVRLNVCHKFLGKGVAVFGRGLEGGKWSGFLSFNGALESGSEKVFVIA